MVTMTEHMTFSVDAVLFDIDGTLVDSTPAVNRSWSAWAGDHGLDAERVLAVCHGRRSTDTIADVLPGISEEGLAAEAADLERRESSDMDGVTALPGAADLLAAVSALSPVRWAAVTSGPRALMTARLRAAGLPEPEVLVTAEDVAVGKPDPEGYRQAASALRVDPARCLVVEDAPAGLAAGRAAGGGVLAVATSHPREELVALPPSAAPDALVSNLTGVHVEKTDTGLTVSMHLH